MKNKQKHYVSIPKYTSWQEALGYMDDICHGKNMPFDPHELKELIESDIKEQIEGHNEILRETYAMRNNCEFLIYCVRDLGIDVMLMLKIGLQRYNYLHKTKYNLQLYNNLYNVINGKAVQ